MLAIRPPRSDARRAFFMERNIFKKNYDDPVTFRVTPALRGVSRTKAYNTENNLQLKNTLIMGTIIGLIIRGILSLAVANCAENNGKSFGGYAALSFFVSPIVGYIFAR